MQDGVLHATHLIVVRHAETEANVQQVWQGALDAPLTQRGKHQVAATAKRLAELAQSHPVDRFYVSPLPRARLTAAAIADRLNLAPQIDAALREFDLGDWEGRSFRDLREQEHLWERWARDPHFAPPNGESPFSFGTRVVKAFDELAQRHRGETVLVVTHGGVICNVLASWLGAGLQDWRNWEPHNCAISLLALDGSRWQPRLLNDISHLPDDALFEEDKSVYQLPSVQSSD